MRTDFLVLYLLILGESLFAIMFLLIRLIINLNRLSQHQSNNGQGEIIIINISWNDILKVVLPFLGVNAIIYLFVFSFLFITKEIPPNWSFLLSVVPVILPLVFLIRPKKLDEKNIPFIVQYKDVEDGFVENNQIEDLVISIESLILNLRSFEGEQLDQIILDAKRAIDNYSNATDYQPIVELVRLISQEIKNIEVELNSSLSNNIFVNASKLSHKAEALRYVIQARLPIESYLNIFKDISKRLFTAPIGDIPIEYLIDLYCGVLRLALTEGTYSQKSKKILVEDFTLIFSHFNDKYSPSNPPVKIIDVVCKEYSALRPVIRDYLPTKGYAHDDAVTSMVAFERRYMPRSNKDGYNILEWIEEFKSQRKG